MEEREPRFDIWSTPRQPNRWNAYFKMLQEQFIYGVYGSSCASHDIGWAFKEEKKIPTIIELSPEEEF